eukprot:augustus_masked-scaffold_8-processed-gene-12.4-mRNA-1 protein AED:1.00 eAED:1.00 QI:0/-1/0/0/-1/1/1/0/1010
MNLQWSVFALWLLESDCNGVGIDDVVVEYNFLLDECLRSAEFQNTGSLHSVGSMKSFSFGEDGKTFTCPSISLDALYFENCSNGFEPVSHGYFGGLASANFFDSGVLSDHKFALSFWLYIKRFEQDMKIFELSSSTKSTQWRGGYEQEYDVSISLRNSFQVQVTMSTGPTSSIDRIFEVPAALTAHQLIFLVVSFDGSQLTCFLDGKEVNILNPTVNGFVFGENRKLTLGGGYEKNAVPFYGFFVYFAVFTLSLSQEDVSKLYYSSKLMNNRPTISDFTYRKVEDEILQLNFSDLVFDLDQLPPLNSRLSLSFFVMSLPSLGHFIMNGIPITKVPSLVQDADIIEYKQQEANTFGFTEFFQVKVLDSEKPSAEVEKCLDFLSAATLSIEVAEANDAPIAFSTEVFLPFSRTGRITLTGSDVDFPVLQEEAFLPIFFTVSFSEENTVYLGSLVDCDSGVQLEQTVRVNSSIVRTDNYIFAANVCFKANNSRTPDHEGTMGSQFYNLVLEDGAGGKSAMALLTVRVVVDLFVGCGEVGGTPCETIIANDETSEIYLRIADALCDEMPKETVSDTCTISKNQIHLTAPFVASEAGELSYWLRDDIFKLLFNYTDTSSIEETVSLPVGLRSLNFTPAGDYFNLADNPICSTGTQFKCAGFIEKSFIQDDALKCTGKHCGEGLTSSNLLGTVIGNCGSSVELGCPVEIHYTFSFRNLTSPARATLGQEIWIKPSSSMAMVSSLKMNSNLSFDLIGRLDERVTLRKLPGDTIFLTDKFQNLRNVFLRICLSANSQNFGRLSLLMNATEFRRNEVNLIIANDPDEEADDVGTICYFNGCPPGRDILIAAPVDTVNKILERLTIQVFDLPGDTTSEIDLILTFSYLEASPKSQTVRFPVKIRSEIQYRRTVEDFFGLMVGFSGISLICFGYSSAKRRRKIFNRRRRVKKYSSDCVEIGTTPKALSPEPVPIPEKDDLYNRTNLKPRKRAMDPKVNKRRIVDITDEDFIKYRDVIDEFL